MSSKNIIIDTRKAKKIQRKAHYEDKKTLIRRNDVLARLGKYVFKPHLLKRSSIKRPIRYQAIVYLRRKRNNLCLTLTDLLGKVITTSSSGFFKFNSYAGVLPNAAQASAKRLTFFLKAAKVFRIALIVKSKVPAVVFGVIRGFKALGISVRRLMDRIPVAHNGVKRKKIRRK